MRKSILIILFALLGILSARAYDFEVDGIYYNLISDTSIGVTYSGSSSNEYSESVVIPSMVEYDGKTYMVTTIGSWAFHDCYGLTSVTIGESVTSIGEYAFGYCMDLTSVTIGESVTTIGEGAFYGCSSLTSVVWNAVVYYQDMNNWDWVEDLPFYSCENITSITFGNQVEYIPAGLCYGMNKLTSVTIGESVTTIEWRAFEGCSGLTSVTIPESMASIKNRAFYGCSGLTSVTIPEGVDTIWYETFYGCSGLTTVTIPESMTFIGDGAFSNCSGLTSVTIPESVAYIGSQAFRNCSGLTSVTIPESVTFIGYGAFSNCSGLTSVTIPESVDTIGDFAFSGCTLIGNPLYNSKVFAYMPQDYSGNYAILSGIRLIVGGAFMGCSGLISVTIPKSVAYIGPSAFSGCSGLTSVTLPENVTSIGSQAFRNCSGLTSITVPEGVTTIEEKTFEDCSGLTSVTIPEGVTSISSSAFSGCSGLTTVEWNAISCQDSPFADSKDITSITFGKKVKHIPAYLCYGMNKLTSVTIPESVTSIGSRAFSGCGGLTSVEWNAVSCQDFDGSSYNKSYLPFSDCENITSITFGSKVEHIPAYLCYGMNKLRLLTIPTSVTSIGANVFGGCDGLISVTSLAKLPPYCEEENVFGSASEYYQTLYVPRGCKSAYESAKEWHKFSKIEEIETYTVTVLANDADMGSVVGGGNYREDEQVMLTAKANQGYHFVKWDDENTDNPRMLTVTEDITLTAIFAKDEENPDDPNNPDNPTPNENPEADNFRVYVQNRTICLSEARGLVQVYNMAGQCVYNGHATAIPVQRSGVYILVVGSQRLKVLVR